MIFTTELVGVSAQYSAFVRNRKNLEQIAAANRATLKLDRQKHRINRNACDSQGSGPINGFTMARGNLTIKGYRDWDSENDLEGPESDYQLSDLVETLMPAS